MYNRARAGQHFPSHPERERGAERRHAGNDLILPGQPASIHPLPAPECRLNTCIRIIPGGGSAPACAHLSGQVEQAGEQSALIGGEEERPPTGRLLGSGRRRQGGRRASRRAVPESGHRVPLSRSGESGLRVGLLRCARAPPAVTDFLSASQTAREPRQHAPPICARRNNDPPPQHTHTHFNLQVPVSIRAHLSLHLIGSQVDYLDR